MMITSNKNPEIKFLKSLELKKYRERERVFVIEGVRIIEDALNDGAEFVKVFHAPMLLGNTRGMELLHILRSTGVEETLLEDRLFTEVSGTEAPQGLLAVLKQPDYALHDLFAQKSLYPHIILLNSLQDPGNLGTILRTAACAGWAGAVLTKGTVDLYNSKSLRATMGALHKLPICRIEETVELFALARTQGYRIVCADVSGAKWHFQTDFTRPVLLVVGNEGNGIEEDILQSADELVKIPMAPGAESLNVAIATGVLIFEGVRQNLIAG